MIVTCENCNSNFELDDDLVSESAAEVKCSKCDHAFTVHRPGSVEEPEGVAEETPEQSLDLDLGGAEEETPEQSLDLEFGDFDQETTEQSLDLDLSDEEGPGEADLDLETLDLNEEPSTGSLPDGQEELDLEALSRALEEEEPDEVEDHEHDGVLDFDMLDEEEAPAEAEIDLESLSTAKEPKAESFDELQKPPEEGLPGSFELEEPEKALPDNMAMASFEEPSAGGTKEEIKEVKEPSRPPRVAPKMAEPPRKTIGGDYSRGSRQRPYCAS